MIGMNVKKSIVLTALLPAAETEQRIFEMGASTMKAYDLSVIEFYSPWDTAKRRGDFLKSHGLWGVYLAATYQKRNHSHLCSLGNRERKSAVEDAKHCIDAASDAQIKSILFTSGRRPDDPAQYQSAYSALVDSLSELMEYAPQTMDVVLEPGDCDVDAMQLVGPTELAIRFANDIRKEYSNFFLTMDTSHIAQLGENALTALRKASCVCHHVHLANCILQKANPLYGDKHPLFGCMNGVYDDEELHAVYDNLVVMFQQERRDLTIAVEVISRNDEEFGWMDEVIKGSPWFFSKIIDEE